jgi:hypothetical protein
MTMPKPFHVALACLGLASAGLALEASEATAASVGEVSCRIRAVPSRGGVHLEGLATAKSPVSGSYELKVTTGGGGGSSETAQSGAFTARPGEGSTLGEVSLALESGSFYSAVLTVTWPGGSQTCAKHSSQI